jgi:excisionase family DNA binding protein
MARTDVRDKRASHAPSPPHRDPALDESVVEILARMDKTLAALVTQKAADERRGQPTQARPPPLEDDVIRVYSVDDVAKLLKIAKSTIYWNLTNGLLPGVKVGGRWVVSHAALVRLLESGNRPQQREEACEAAE